MKTLVLLGLISTSFALAKDISPKQPQSCLKLKDIQLEKVIKNINEDGNIVIIQDAQGGSVMAIKVNKIEVIDSTLVLDGYPQNVALSFNLEGTNYGIISGCTSNNSVSVKKLKSNVVQILLDDMKYSGN